MSAAADLLMGERRGCFPASSLFSLLLPRAFNGTSVVLCLLSAEREPWSPSVLSAGAQAGDGCCL